MNKLIRLEVVSAPAIKIPKLINGDDEAIAARFGELFEDAQSGTRRIVAFGVFAWFVKLACLRHGKFGDWVKGRYGESAYRSVRSHMQLTKSTLEEAGVKSLKPFFRNGSVLPICKSGEFLLLPEKKVPEGAQPLRNKIFSIIDGKSARQLFHEFKQVEDEDAEVLKSKRGRRKGEGGASAEQRAAAKAAAEQDEIDAMESDAEDFCKWIDKMCDAKHLPRVSQKVWEKVRNRADQLTAFMRSVDNSRKGGAK